MSSAGYLLLALALVATVRASRAASATGQRRTYQQKLAAAAAQQHAVQAQPAQAAQKQWEDPCRDDKIRTTPHVEYCDRYYACADGQPVEVDCPNGLVYVGRGLSGPFDGVCDYAFNVECAGREKRSTAAQKQTQEDPCQLKSRVVGDATYCDRYWECVSGQPELYDCPNGLVFAGKNRGVTEGCDYPWRSNYCDGKQLANPPISTEHCDWLYGIFGHETSCTRYWTCWNGTATEQLCIGGLLYNEDMHSCDWPENVDGCQKHPLCNDDANGNVPLGKSCNRYWQCQGGYPRLQRCPAMLVFDRRSLRCVVPPTEDCEVPTTQAPPPEELEQDNDQNIPAGGNARGGNTLPPGAVPLPLRPRPRN